MGLIGLAPPDQQSPHHGAGVYPSQRIQAFLAWLSRVWESVRPCKSRTLCLAARVSHC